MIQISEDQIDIIKEIINIGVGKAANLLNQLVNKRILLSVPSIIFSTTEELPNYLKDFSSNDIASIILDFKGDFSGSCQLLFATDDAHKLVSIFTEEDIIDQDEFNEIRQSTLSEIGNIVLNSLIGTISNVLAQKFIYTPPKFKEDNVNKLFNLNNSKESHNVLLATTRFEMEDTNIVGDFLLVFETGSNEILLEKIDIINENGVIFNGN